MSDLPRRIRAELHALHTRHGRKKSNLCCCEGKRAVGELFAAAPERVRYVICTPPLRYEFRYPVEPTVLSEIEFSEIAGTVNSQGILAVADCPPPPGEDEVPRDPFLAALDRVGDPGNFGTICRTVLAAGLTELWHTEGTVDPWGDKTIRSALGAQFRLKLRAFPDLATLAAAARKFGYNTVYLTDPHGGENCFSAPDLFNRSVVVIGSEGAGVGDLNGARRVMIPMPGNFESLNAAQAATIFLFEHVRRSTVQ